MFYNARYYSPLLSRFVSADTTVPDGDKASIIPLTVDFHEPMFLAGVAGENAFTLQNGFWSQLSGKQKEKAKLPWGPQNPQALNRYAYVMNNPLRYNDPTGHENGGTYEIGYERIDDEPGVIKYLIWFDDQVLTIRLEKGDSTFDLEQFIKFADAYATAQRDVGVHTSTAVVATLTSGSAFVAAAATSPTLLVPVIGVPLLVFELGAAVGGAVSAALNGTQAGLAKLDEIQARKNAAEYFARLMYPGCTARWVNDSEVTAGTCQ